MPAPLAQQRPSTTLPARPAARWSGGPLYLFVGIDTAGSSVHRAFGSWAPHFGLEAQLRGVDLPESTDRPTWRRLVTALRDNPAVHGAVVTSHKLRLYRACSDLFDTAEPLVDLTHEVSALDTRDGVHAYARDVQSLDLTLRGASAASVAAGRPLVCLGTGGAATALLLATRLDRSAGWPSPCRALEPTSAGSRAPQGHSAYNVTRCHSWLFPPVHTHC
jgi:shikimate dehydrogenase